MKKSFVSVVLFRQTADKPTLKIKVADAYLKLGEIAIESGNYIQAKDDLNKCLQIQQVELKPDDRLIAESYPSPTSNFMTVFLP